jgi:hypothetical protein
MPERSPEPASPLIRALADAAISAAQNMRKHLVYALDHDEPLYVACDCREDIGLQRCDCRVVLGMGSLWMRSASARLEQGEGVSPPPRRRCRLCRSGDHDLVDTHEVTMTVEGRAEEWTTRMLSPRRSNKRHIADRVARAGAHPPSALEDQREAAGIR